MTLIDRLLRPRDKSRAPTPTPARTVTVDAGQPGALDTATPPGGTLRVIVHPGHVLHHYAVGLTTCCRLAPHELPAHDDITDNPRIATCTGAVG